MHTIGNILAGRAEIILLQEMSIQEDPLILTIRK
jgi:hypothetical protein